MDMQAETSLMHLQAKELQRLPASQRMLGERPGTHSLIYPSDTLISDFYPRELGENKFFLRPVVCSICCGSSSK